MLGLLPRRLDRRDGGRHGAGRGGAGVLERGGRQRLRGGSRRPPGGAGEWRGGQSISGTGYFQLSLAWFDTILDSHPLDDVAGYTDPVLAVVGSDDDVVRPEISDIFLATVASTDTTLHTIDGADHGFTAEQEYGDEAIAVTTDWLATQVRCAVAQSPAS